MMARYIHGTRFSINNELSSFLILKHCCRDKNDRNDIRVWTSCTEYRGQLWVSKDKEIQRVQKIGQKRKKSMALTNVFVIPRMNDIWNHSIHFLYFCVYISTIRVFIFLWESRQYTFILCHNKMITMCCEKLIVNKYVRIE